jgi:hypothetical protein
MQKIVELNLNEIEAVTGGHKTVNAATTTTYRPVAASTVTAQSFAKPVFATPTSLSVSAYRF